MNKQTLATIVFTALMVGLVGFYSGRYYERKTFRSSMPERANTGQFPSGDQPRMGGQRPEGIPAPEGTENPTESTDSTQDSVN